MNKLKFIIDNCPFETSQLTAVLYEKLLANIRITFPYDWDLFPAVANVAISLKHGVYEDFNGTD